MLISDTLEQTKAILLELMKSTRHRNFGLCHIISDLYDNGKIEIDQYEAFESYLLDVNSHFSHFFDGHEKITREEAEEEILGINGLYHWDVSDSESRLQWLDENIKALKEQEQLIIKNK